MLNVTNMSPAEMSALLETVGYGHLGCAWEGRPYVIPMHYAFAGDCIYFLTTEGEKTRILAANPEVCLQVEVVYEVTRWRSVIVTGRAEKLIYQQEIESAMNLLTQNNPTLTPALNHTQVADEGRPNFLVLYRLRPVVIDGRKTV